MEILYKIHSIKRSLKFSVIKRSVRHLYQRITRGWDDSDTWSLDYTISKFALPRLKRFKELNNGRPMGLSEEKWDEMIDMMIYAHESCIKDISMEDGWEDIDWDDVHTGFQFFGEYFMHLWW